MSGQDCLGFVPVQQQIGIENYSINFESPLGTGASATIYLACRKHPSKSEGVVPKRIVIKAPPLQKKAESMKILRTEVEALASIEKHPNIVRLHGFCNIAQETEETPWWALQIEYCNGGDLVTATAQCRFPEDKAHDVMTCVLQGLAHVHKHGFVHRDVKPDNVLLTKDGDVKLADFGLSVRVTDSTAMTKKCGSPGYVAPEVWLSRPYGIKVDSFSAGALLYFIISGKLAFTGSSVETVMQRTVSNPVNFRRSVRLERLSDACKEFIGHLMAKDPACRPSASEAVDAMWTYPVGCDSVKGSLEQCDCEGEADGISERATTYRESEVWERSTCGSSLRSSKPSSVEIPSNHRRAKFSSCPGVARNSHPEEHDKPQRSHRRYSSERSAIDRSSKVDDELYASERDDILLLEEMPSQPQAAHRQLGFARQRLNAARRDILCSEGKEPATFEHKPRPPAETMPAPSPAKRRFSVAKQHSQSDSAKSL